ncbi:MAG: DNA-protecting protein DprA [Flavobacteriales bacterium]|nr:DNA-processing protein DprA [Flavobacteriales bacterium]MCB9190849.1 DNA-protecting protein DprA [Flavobacteriales bacterium]MCB9204857.1 DNA-protecting protein DprA [Flavobacteriales bacterium]
MEQTQHLIALSMIPGLGDSRIKKLVAYCGGAKEVFSQPQHFLEKIPNIGSKIAASVSSKDVLLKAEKEIAFTEKNGVSIISFLDQEYPQRLKHCDDAPVVLYKKGAGSINPPKAVAIVGTRNATREGKEITEKLVEELAIANVTIVSGLAYGIDIAAHKACLKNNIPTIGCLAHGLDRIYPKLHERTANEMLENGALITDFPIGTNPDRENFPKRNRIVAGMADATIVVEAAAKGGALITAELANGYNRDVFAVPGRVSDPYSEGCNSLIKYLKAAMVTSGKDVLRSMGWDEKASAKKPEVQKKLLINLTEDQEKVVSVLQQQEHTIDRLSVLAELPMSKVATVLLELEFEGIVSNLPGKVYKLN